MAILCNLPILKEAIHSNFNFSKGKLPVVNPPTVVIIPYQSSYIRNSDDMHRFAERYDGPSLRCYQLLSPILSRR